MKMYNAPDVVGRGNWPAKYSKNLLRTKKKTRNNASNKIIKPILSGFDFISLKLFANNESITNFFVSINKISFVQNI